MNTPIDLSGTWEFHLGGDEPPPEFKQSIRLPGSLQEQGFGDEVGPATQWTGQIVDRSWFTDDRYAPYRKPGNIKVPFWLQPERHYVGSAWFSREIDIPADWQGRRVILTLERPHIQTTLWVDDRKIGSENSLGMPHLYDLGTSLAPGPHTLTLCVDNRMHVDVGPNSHSVTDHTQSNWNGVAGRITLGSTSPVWIDDAQVFPNVANRTARIAIKIGNATGAPGKGILRAGEHSAAVSWDETGGHAEIVHAMPSDAALWDEFSPALHRLKLRLEGPGAGDEREIGFGLREPGVEGTQITINGRKIFLRGTLECAVFPRTGYPPADIDSWRRIFQICRDYGFNHVRFHSWCPPEAAFAVADELGFYLQIECSSWANTTTGLGNGEPVDEWLYKEARAIIKAHGNHPSFVLFAYGNEPGGEHHPDYLAKWVEYWKKEEPRRLHTSAAGWPALPVNDYDNIPAPRIQQWGEELKSRINALPPATAADYRSFVERAPRPIVSHEIGQWCVYPDLSEIPNYTGVLKAKNFEIFRETLEANQMGRQARDFLMASGRLQVLCYKEEIESALRTRGFGGFQILQANDFPGQGTALVGWLDPFWESKGYTTPEEFRRFNNSTVLLARLDRRVFATLDLFHAAIEIAHYGPAPIGNARVSWEIVGATGEAHFSGEFPARAVPTGEVTRLGEIELPLAECPAPGKYRLVVSLAACRTSSVRARESRFEAEFSPDRGGYVDITDAEPGEIPPKPSVSAAVRAKSDRLLDGGNGNDWDFWVYPSRIDVHPREEIFLAREWKEVLEHAGNDRKILFIPPAESIAGDVGLGFSSIFWNTAWTRGQAPHTLGLLCDPRHPLFEHFPTEFCSNWQWWEIIQAAAAMVLDPLPADLEPLVQVIDDWFTNRRLGLLFEARFRGSSILVSGVDIARPPADRHALRQFAQSVFDYMGSSAFRPQTEIGESALLRVFKTSSGPAAPTPPA